MELTHFQQGWGHSAGFWDTSQQLILMGQRAELWGNGGDEAAGTSEAAPGVSVGSWPLQKIFLQSFFFN